MAESKFAGAIRLPSVKFGEIGESVTGTVRSFNTEATVPLFDDKGRVIGDTMEEDGVTPKTQLDIDLGTDKGLFTLHTGGAIFYAIGRALAALEADDLEAGDILTVTHTGVADPTAKGRNGAKQFEAEVIRGAFTDDAVTAPDTDDAVTAPDTDDDAATVAK